MRQLYLLGGAVRVLGDRPRARQLFAEAAGLAEPGDPWAWAWRWLYVADLAVDEGEHDRAGELYGAALRYLQRAGWRTGVGWVVQRLGILAIRAGDPRRGVRLVAVAHDTGQSIAVHYPELPHERRAALGRARATLGEAAFGLAWDVGRALPLGGRRRRGAAAGASGRRPRGCAGAAHRAPAGGGRPDRPGLDQPPDRRAAGRLAPHRRAPRRAHPQPARPVLAGPGRRLGRGARTAPPTRRLTAPRRPRAGPARRPRPLPP